MKPQFAETSFIHKNIKKLMIAWLKSDWRKYLLDFRYFYLADFFNKKPKAQIFLALNDPHSLILIQILPDLVQRFHIDFELCLISESLSRDISDPQNWRRWALQDANLLASQYHLKAIEKLPEQRSLITGQQLWQIQRHSLQDACDIFCKTWYGGFTEHFQSSTPVINSQFKNQDILLAKGHYLPSTILFCGEWYLGLDRIDYFEEKLINFNLAKSKNMICGQKNRLKFYLQTSDLNLDHQSPITVYLSLRSPYSYLGFKQVQQLSKHYGVPLIIKPVLPLVMRDFNVSKNKMRYIFLDSIREAKALNIPFGNFADPIGQGVINCYQLFAYAEQKDKTEVFMAAMFDAVYVEGINLTIRKNVEKICQQLELDYQQAIDFDQQKSTQNKDEQQQKWRSWADQNLIELNAMDFWGVPCFVYKNVKVWGQDRLWLIENEIITNTRK